ncbi:MAG: protein-glutamate O-methyltransferase CheR [Pirellulales bacterium]|nr:protein-glutamate O-methyltransferase CheR [Pirellulales bacterium]
MNREADILELCDLVQTLCGISLNLDKKYLLDSRLQEILEAFPGKSYGELVQSARQPNQGHLRTQLIDALTTNETLFFRDMAPFEAIKHKLLPELLDAQEEGVFSGPIRIWSAACSTGQEAYSLAMIVRDLLSESEFGRVTILGTDVSDAAIQAASRGCYSDHVVGRGLDNRLLDRHFTRTTGGWQVRDELRGLVAFKRANLLESFEHLGVFDIIMCRNVAIYFTPEARRDLFLRLRQRMRNQSAAIFVGSAESLLDCDGAFTPEEHCRATLYR